MNEKFVVIWRGNEIEHYEITGVDMWYTDGIWIPNESEKAIEFANLVKKFGFVDMHKSPEKGTRVLLKTSIENEEGMHALVIGMVDGFLSLRSVFDSNAIKWMIKHVK